MVDHLFVFRLVARRFIGDFWGKSIFLFCYRPILPGGEIPRSLQILTDNFVALGQLPVCFDDKGDRFFQILPGLFQGFSLGVCSG